MCRRSRRKERRNRCEGDPEDERDEVRNAPGSDPRCGSTYPDRLYTGDTAVAWADRDDGWGAPGGPGTRRCWLVARLGEGVGGTPCRESATVRPTDFAEHGAASEALATLAVCNPRSASGTEGSDLRDARAPCGSPRASHTRMAPGLGRGPSGRAKRTSTIRADASGFGPHRRSGRPAGSDLGHPPSRWAGRFRVTWAVARPSDATVGWQPHD
jgi:hypothetical protein